MIAKLEPFGWILLGGLIVGSYQAALGKKTKKESSTSNSYAQRKLAAHDVVKAGPQITVSETPQGTVIQLNIPKTSFDGGLVEIKRCIVWRDTVTKTAALSCDKDEIDMQSSATNKPAIER